MFARGFALFDVEEHARRILDIHAPLSPCLVFLRAIVAARAYPSYARAKRRRAALYARDVC